MSGDDAAVERAEASEPDPIEIVRAWQALEAPPLDPAGLAVLAGLARRAEACQVRETRRVLMRRLADRLAALPISDEVREETCQAGHGVPPARGPSTSEAVDIVARSRTAPRVGSGPLAGLSELIDRLGREPRPEAAEAPAAGRQATTKPSSDPRAAEGRAPAPPLRRLRAATQFQATWSQLRAERRLRQAFAQVPKTAGPLNSAHLVNQVLHVMRAASPAYFDAFTAHVDTLLGLEAMTRLVAPPGATAPAGARPKAGPSGTSKSVQSDRTPAAGRAQAKSVGRSTPKAARRRPPKADRQG